VKSLQRVVRNLAPEIKYLDVDLASSNITTSGTTTQITAVAQGDTQSTRTGNTINVTSVSIIGRWSKAGDTAYSGNAFYRWAVVVDKEQVADTLPAASAIFTGSPIGNFPNLDNLERFRILYLSPVFENARMSSDTDATTSVATINSHWKWSWKGNIKVSYNGTAGTDIEKNGIYVVYLSNDTQDTIDVAATARIGYTDV